MPQFGQIRPELGRIDFSPIARGGQAFGQGVGQGLAQLGAGIGQAIQKHREKKQDKVDFEEFRKFSESLGLAPDEASVAWKTGGKQGAWQWAQGAKQSIDQKRDFGIALNAIGTAYPATEDGRNEFSIPEYLRGFADMGGQDQKIALQILDLGQRFGMVPEKLSEKDQAQIDLIKAQTENLQGGKAPSPSQIDKSLDNAAEEFVGLSEQEKAEQYDQLPPEVRSRVDEKELDRALKKKSLEGDRARPFTKAEAEKQYAREIDEITLGEYARKLRDLESGATKGQLDAKWWKPGIFEQDRIPEFDRILSQNPELFLEGTPQEVIDNIGTGKAFSTTPGGSGIKITAR